MVNRIHIFLVFLSFCTAGAQQSKLNEVDRYLEDQFYIGVGINFLTDRPTDVVQNSLSYNLQLGFVKDLPINKKRNFGLGLGIGYATNSYYSNIGAENSDAGITYSVLPSDEFIRSKFETHAIEMPLELRWRTSTPTDYRFWRLYGGLRFAYIFSGSSRLVTEESTNRFSNGDIRDLQYGLSLNFGYNTFNLHAYYGLNQLLENNAQLETNESIDSRVIRLGVIFYIL